MATFDEVEDEIIEQTKKGNVKYAELLLQLHGQMIRKLDVEATYIRGNDVHHRVTMEPVKVEVTEPREEQPTGRRCHPGCTRTDCDSAQEPREKGPAAQPTAVHVNTTGPDGEPLPCLLEGGCPSPQMPTCAAHGGICQERVQLNRRLRREES